MGQSFQSYYNEAAFNSAVIAANRPNTLVIVDAPQGSYAFSSLAGFVSGGGRVLIQAYSFAGSPTLAATFQVALESRSTTPLPLYNWGGAILFAGLSSPLSFSEINLNEDSQKLYPLLGAEAVAGFTGDPVSGEGAVVIGNGGRTIVNGFYVEGASSGPDATRLAQNEISFLLGIVPPPVVLVIPNLSVGQFGFGVTGPSGSTVLIETSTDLTNWQAIDSVVLDNGSNYFTAPLLGDGPRFFRASAAP